MEVPVNCAIERGVMKAHIFVAVLLLFSLGCTSQPAQPSPQLTQQQQDQIKSEVKAVLDSLIAKWAALDAEGFLQSYSTDMVAVGGGVPHDFQAYRRGSIDYLTSTATIAVTTVREDYRVLTTDLVISTWVGKVVRSMKSGDKRTTDQMLYADVWKKIGGTWKVIDESPSGTAVIQKAGTN